jgi:hypothetical protein
MNTPNDEVTNTENVENSGAEATCAPGCDCNAGGGGFVLVGYILKGETR